MKNNSAIVRGSDIKKVFCEVDPKTRERRLFYDFGDHQVMIDEVAINKGADAMDAAMMQATADHIKTCTNCRQARGELATAIEERLKIPNEQLN